VLAFVLKIVHGVYGSFVGGCAGRFLCEMDLLRGKKGNLHTAQPGPKLLLSHQVADIVYDGLGKGAAERQVCRGREIVSFLTLEIGL
jgi:hypothetical protein